MTALLSYEKALPVVAAKYPRPNNARLVPDPTDKVLVHPALERWRKGKELGK